MKNNVFYIRFSIGLLLYLLTVTGFSQQYTFRNYSVDEELAQSQVYAMCEDNNGNIWFGTRGGGISRFDGIEFTNYTTQEGLVSNYIRCLLKDASGTIWIGTDNGLSIYDGKTFSTFTKVKGLSDVAINDLIQGSEGIIWVASETGIYHTLNDSLVAFASESGAPSERINCLVQDNSGILWAGTENGLYRFSLENNRWNMQHLTTREGLPNNIITALARHENGGIWICTYGGGAAALQDGVFTYLNKSNGLAGNTVFDCLSTDNGTVWFATSNGLSKYDPANSGIFMQITETEGLSKNVVMSILKDSFGNLWFGTSGGGISRLSSERFIHYTAIKGVFGTWVYAILQDRTSLMWFGTSEGGVTTYDGTLYKRFSERNGFTASKVKCMKQDVAGNIWLGTIADGVYMYNGKTFRHFSVRNGLSSNFINDILIDANGRIWLATAGGGISCLLPSSNNTYTVKNIRTRDGLAGDRVNTLTADHDGNIWAGTAGYGISVIQFSAEDKKTTIRNFHTSEGLASNTIRCSLTDRNGNIFFGTADAGLILYKDKTFYSFTKQQGLSSNNIYSCILDAEGKLWIGTDKGIDQIAFLNYTMQAVKHYGKSEGFTGIETMQNAVYLDNKGKLWFGTVKSATSFNPSADRELQAPHVHITGMHLFFDKIEQTPFGKVTQPWYPLPETLILPYDQNHLSFDCIGIEQANPEAVRYSWILVGFDKRWSPPTEKREAVYSNLPPGTYTFKVNAVNEDGHWSKNPAEYTFTILPPFWDTWWFILMTICMSGLLIWWLVLTAIRKLKKENAQEKQRLETERSLMELEQKALRLQMNPHFLFNCLNSIKGLIAEDKPEEAKIYLSKFAKQMRTMLDHSMEALISLENEINGLRIYAELEKLSHEDAFDFAIEIDPALDVSFIQIPPMLIQPFVENAILHGLSSKQGKGTVKVSFTLEGIYLKCVIEDDGIGRKKAAEMKEHSTQAHKSAAITVTQERLNILNKKLNLEAINIQVTDLMDDEYKSLGTRVSLLIPFQQ